MAPLKLAWPIWVVSMRRVRLGASGRQTDHSDREGTGQPAEKIRRGAEAVVFIFSPIVRLLLTASSGLPSY